MGHVLTSLYHFLAKYASSNSNYFKISGFSSKNVQYPRYQDTDLLQLCVKHFIWFFFQHHWKIMILFMPSRPNPLELDGSLQESYMNIYWTRQNQTTIPVTITAIKGDTSCTEVKTNWFVCCCCCCVIVKLVV